MIIPHSVRSAAELAALLTDGVEIVERVALDVGGCRVDVVTNEPRLRERLSLYFHDHLTRSHAPPDFRIVAVEAPVAEVQIALVEKAPDPGKTRVKEEYHDFRDGRLVRKRLTGMVFAFGGWLHVAYGPCLANDNQIVNFVNNRYMQWRLQQGYVLCHAGAVAREGRALALCGTSGAGKSTTALALVRAGLDFVSNDRTLLKPRDGGVELLGIPKHPRVNPGTLVHNPMLRGLLSEREREDFLSMPPDELRRLERKYDVLIDQVVGPGRFPLQADLHALVVIAWDGDGPARIRAIDLAERLDLLAHVVKSPGLFYEPDQAASDVDLSPEAYLDVLRRRPIYEITGSRDFRAARDLCLRALESEGA